MPRSTAVMYSDTSAVEYCRLMCCFVVVVVIFGGGGGGGGRGAY